MTDSDPDSAPADRPKTIKVGGVLNPRRHVYIQRLYETDAGGGGGGGDIFLEDALRERLLRGEDITVVGSRHAGKSSLINYVGLELEEEHGFHKAWANVDLGLAKATNQEERCAEVLLSYSMIPCPPGTKLLNAIELMLKATGKARLLIVLDEFDTLQDSGINGAALVQSIRAIQQQRDGGDDRLSGVVFCFTAIAARGPLFDSSSLFGRPETAAEVTSTSLEVGLFSASAKTTADLAHHFKKHDPTGASNLALAVIQEAGGYPQLCMALARRLVTTGQRYTVRDLQLWFNKQALWFKNEALDPERQFLDITESIIRHGSTRDTLDALGLYQATLTFERDLALSITAEHAQRAAVWERETKGLRRLRQAGLVRRDDEGRVRSIGGFMDRYFDSAWARRIQSELAQDSIAHTNPEEVAARRTVDRPKILVFLTGGTIGMVERGGKVKPPNDAGELQREYRQVEERFDVEWRIFRPELLDSANVGPRHWGEFAKTVHAELRKDYVGVVIAHGTDTLSFTASALAFALGTDLDKPVVLTGSQTTVDHIHGDARSNLLRACMVAATPGLPEVVIVFGEHVFRGVRAVKRDDRRFDAFESLLYPPLGMVSETVQLQPEVIRQSDGAPTPSLQAKFADGIAVISQVPGLLPAFYKAALRDPDCRPRGLVIQTLGAGNIPTLEPYELSDVIRTATGQGIPVLLASQYPVHPRNLGLYGPSRIAIEAGAIPVANMTVAATVAKFSWILGQMGNDVDLETVRLQMLHNYVGELDRFDAEELLKRRPG